VYQRFNNPKEEVDKLLFYLETKTIKIIPKNKVKVFRDEKDNQILALFLAGNADFLITGDKDLLAVKEFKKTKIVKTKEFLKIIQD
jgi:putative PIN family toxin of toxin-antitoxin system